MNNKPSKQENDKDHYSLKKRIIIITICVAIIAILIFIINYYRVNNRAVRAVKTTISDQLIDPYSAKFSPMIKCAVDMKNEPKNAFFVYGNVNSKNRLGAYVGKTEFLGIFYPKNNNFVVIKFGDENHLDKQDELYFAEFKICFYTKKPEKL